MSTHSSIYNENYVSLFQRKKNHQKHVIPQKSKTSKIRKFKMLKRMSVKLKYLKRKSKFIRT